MISFKYGGINVYSYRDGKLTNRTTARSKQQFEELTIVEESIDKKIVLECSTKGDKRFSAFGAKVKVYNHEDIIEFHYFLSKRFNGIEAPSTTSSWQDKMDYVKLVKNKYPDHIQIKDKILSVDMMHMWYHLLWVKYLDSKPELVDYLRNFDDYNDIFKGKGNLICQADSIRRYMSGRESLLEECSELLKQLK